MAHDVTVDLGSGKLQEMQKDGKQLSSTKDVVEIAGSSSSYDSAGSSEECTRWKEMLGDDGSVRGGSKEMTGILRREGTHDDVFSVSTMDKSCEEDYRSMIESEVLANEMKENLQRMEQEMLAERASENMMVRLLNSIRSEQQALRAMIEKGTKDSNERSTQGEATKDAHDTLPRDLLEQLLERQKSLELRLSELPTMVREQVGEQTSAEIEALREQLKRLDAHNKAQDGAEGRKGEGGVSSPTIPRLALNESLISPRCTETPPKASLKAPVTPVNTQRVKEQQHSIREDLVKLEEAERSPEALRLIGSLRRQQEEIDEFLGTDVSESTKALLLQTLGTLQDDLAAAKTDKADPNVNVEADSIDALLSGEGLASLLACHECLPSQVRNSVTKQLPGPHDEDRPKYQDRLYCLYKLTSELPSLITDKMPQKIRDKLLEHHGVLSSMLVGTEPVIKECLEQFRLAMVNATRGTDDARIQAHLQGLANCPPDICTVLGQLQFVDGLEKLGVDVKEAKGHLERALPPVNTSLLSYLHEHLMNSKALVQGAVEAALEELRHTSHEILDDSARAQLRGEVKVVTDLLVQPDPSTRDVLIAQRERLLALHSNYTLAGSDAAMACADAAANEVGSLALQRCFKAQCHVLEGIAEGLSKVSRAQLEDLSHKEGLLKALQEDIIEGTTSANIDDILDFLPQPSEVSISQLVASFPGIHDILQRHSSFSHDTLHALESHRRLLEGDRCDAIIIGTDANTIAEQLGNESTGLEELLLEDVAPITTRLAEHIEVLSTLKAPKGARNERLRRAEALMGGHPSRPKDISGVVGAQVGIVRSMLDEALPAEVYSTLASHLASLCEAREKLVVMRQIECTTQFLDAETEDLPHEVQSEIADYVACLKGYLSSKVSRSLVTAEVAERERAIRKIMASPDCPRHLRTELEPHRAALLAYLDPDEALVHQMKRVSEVLATPLDGEARSRLEAYQKLLMTAGQQQLTEDGDTLACTFPILPVQNDDVYERLKQHHATVEAMLHEHRRPSPKVSPKLSPKARTHTDSPPDTGRGCVRKVSFGTLNSKSVRRSPPSAAAARLARAEAIALPASPSASSMTVTCEDRGTPPYSDAASPTSSTGSRKDSWRSIISPARVGHDAHISEQLKQLINLQRELKEAGERNNDMLKQHLDEIGKKFRSEWNLDTRVSQPQGSRADIDGHSTTVALQFTPPDSSRSTVAEKLMEQRSSVASLLGTPTLHGSTREQLSEHVQVLDNIAGQLEVGPRCADDNPSEGEIIEVIRQLYEQQARVGNLLEKNEDLPQTLRAQLEEHERTLREIISSPASLMQVTQEDRPEVRDVPAPTIVPRVRPPSRDSGLETVIRQLTEQVRAQQSQLDDVKELLQPRRPTMLTLPQGVSFPFYCKLTTEQQERLHRAVEKDVSNLLGISEDDVKVVDASPGSVILSLLFSCANSKELQERLHDLIREGVDLPETVRVLQELGWDANTTDDSTDEESFENERLAMEEAARLRQETANDLLLLQQESLQPWAEATAPASDVTLFSGESQISIPLQQPVTHKGHQTEDAVESSSETVSDEVLDRELSHSEPEAAGDISSDSSDEQSEKGAKSASSSSSSWAVPPQHALPEEPEVQETKSEGSLAEMQRLAADCSDSDDEPKQPRQPQPQATASQQPFICMVSPPADSDSKQIKAQINDLKSLIQNHMKQVPRLQQLQQQQQQQKQVSSDESLAVEQEVLEVIANLATQQERVAKLLEANTDLPEAVKEQLEDHQNELQRIIMTPSYTRCTTPDMSPHKLFALSPEVRQALHDYELLLQQQRDSEVKEQQVEQLEKILAAPNIPQLVQAELSRQLQELAAVETPPSQPNEATAKTKLATLVSTHKDRVSDILSGDRVVVQLPNEATTRPADMTTPLTLPQPQPHSSPVTPRSHAFPSAASNILTNLKHDKSSEVSKVSTPLQYELQATATTPAPDSHPLHSQQLSDILAQLQILSTAVSTLQKAKSSSESSAVTAPLATQVPELPSIPQNVQSPNRNHDDTSTSDYSSSPASSSSSDHFSNELQALNEATTILLKERDELLRLQPTYGRHTNASEGSYESSYNVDHFTNETHLTTSGVPSTAPASRASDEEPERVKKMKEDMSQRIAKLETEKGVEPKAVDEDEQYDIAVVPGQPEWAGDLQRMEQRLKELETAETPADSTAVPQAAAAERDVPIAADVPSTAPASKASDEEPEWVKKMKEDMSQRIAKLETEKGVEPKAVDEDEQYDIAVVPGQPEWAGDLQRMEQRLKELETAETPADSTAVPQAAAAERDVPVTVTKGTNVKKIVPNSKDDIYRGFEFLEKMKKKYPDLAPKPKPKCAPAPCPPVAKDLVDALRGYISDDSECEFELTEEEIDAEHMEANAERSCYLSQLYELTTYKHNAKYPLKGGLYDTWKMKRAVAVQDECQVQRNNLATLITKMKTLGLTRCE
eukprot:TRINITY_DN372_c0_g1_i3.p1 TRINITY_DN372_c0_g1~~TRINITY_DN372_c0_g1_i3.p1  ORF type:complete len:2537 (+),score=461.81 TRINITY_DN372_c0_g1_i3:223-7611(+)